MGVQCRRSFSNDVAYRFLFSIFSSEPRQQPLSAQSSSEALSHKQLHAQLTQRLQQVLREREQQEQNPPELRAAGKEAGLVEKPTKPSQTKLSTIERAKGSRADMTQYTVRNNRFLWFKYTLN